MDFSLAGILWVQLESKSLTQIAVCLFIWMDWMKVATAIHIFYTLRTVAEKQERKKRIRLVYPVT